MRSSPRFRLLCTRVSPPAMMREKMVAISFLFLGIPLFCGRIAGHWLLRIPACGDPLVADQFPDGHTCVDDDHHQQQAVCECELVRFRKSPKIAHAVNNAPQNQSALRCIRTVFAASRRRYSASHFFRVPGGGPPTHLFGRQGAFAFVFWHVILRIWASESPNR